jgi:outer membrane receptor protein involved in Fe transport
VRVDHYDGLTSQIALEPRLGLSYSVPATKTVLRASYGRTMETPYNENLLLSSSANPAVFGTSGTPLPPGTRDQIETGVQQALGGWLLVDASYFYKYTKNAYDFDVLFNTPIVFPIAWNHSDLNGISGRVSMVEHGGFTAYTVFGHTNALFFPPGTGGILKDQPTAEFRIDHDQKFEQTSNVQYTLDKSIGAWVALSWQYESGLVAGSVTSYATALSFDGDEQAAIGLYCGSTFATVTAPITSCPAGLAQGATRVVIPAAGTENDLTNPPRVAPRNLFDLGVGVDNLFHSRTTKVRLRFSVVNLTNNEALYNFLSTFSGTHFVTPRAYQAQLGVTF